MDSIIIYNGFSQLFYYLSFLCYIFNRKNFFFLYFIPSIITQFRTNVEQKNWSYSFKLLNEKKQNKVLIFFIIFVYLFKNYRNNNYWFRINYYYYYYIFRTWKKVLHKTILNKSKNVKLQEFIFFHWESLAYMKLILKKFNNTQIKLFYNTFAKRIRLKSKFSKINQNKISNNIFF